MMLRVHRQLQERILFLVSRSKHLLLCHRLHIAVVNLAIRTRHWVLLAQLDECRDGHLLRGLHGAGIATRVVVHDAAEVL